MAHTHIIQDSDVLCSVNLYLSLLVKGEYINQKKSFLELFVVLILLEVKDLFLFCAWSRVRGIFQMANFVNS